MFVYKGVNIPFNFYFLKIISICYMIQSAAEYYSEHNDGL